MRVSLYQQFETIVEVVEVHEEEFVERIENTTEHR
jgi:hypothetical protein